MSLDAWSLQALRDAQRARTDALAYLKSVISTAVKVADRYDVDPKLRDAMALLMPGFEYPDVSHLTLAKLHYHCRKAPDPLV